MESALHHLVSLGSKMGYFKPLTDDQIEQNNTAARRIVGRHACGDSEDYLSNGTIHLTHMRNANLSCANTGCLNFLS